MDDMKNMSTRVHMSTNAELTAKSDDVKLKKYLSEAVASLTTLADEREQLKTIVDAAHGELGVGKKAFRDAAVATHKCKPIEEQEAAVDAVRDILDRVTNIS